MLKRLIIILAIVHINLAFAMDDMPTIPNPAQMMNESVADIIDPPNTAALNIMVSALSSLKCGVLVRVIGPSAKIEANKIGREEFLEPAALIVPCNAFPPLNNQFVHYLSFFRFFTTILFSCQHQRL